MSPRLIFATLLGCGAAEHRAASERDAEAASDAMLDSDSATEAVSIEGSVDGYDIDVVNVLSGVTDTYTFVGTRVHSRHIEVALNSFVDACGSMTSNGTTIYLDLFQNPSLSDSTITGPATFDVWLPSLRGGDIPSDNRVVATYVTVGPQSGFSHLALSGYVNVATITDAELNGDLALQFENGEVSGTFVSARCTDWNRSASVPTPK